ncbi:hypothetical protein SUGI_0566400 [Cryptomeria japonica]|nr:hypothetical protein SUGI_0566400 [Cryptomeria japonica]
MGTLIHRRPQFRMGTLLAVAGVLSGLVVAEGADDMEDKIAEDVAEKIEEDYPNKDGYDDNDASDDY